MSVWIGLACLVRPRKYNGMLVEDIEIFNTMWTATYTYGDNNNGIVSGNYFTQTTTWDEDISTETTAKSR